MASSSKGALWKRKWLNRFKADDVVESNGKKNNISHMMDLSDDENMVFPLHGLDDGRRSKRKKFRCGFTRVVKDVFSNSNTSAAKKTRSKKSGEAVASSPQCGTTSLSSKIQKALTFKKTPSSSPAGGDTSPSDGSLGHSSPTSSLFSSSPAVAGLSSSHSSSSSLSNSTSRSGSGSRSRSERKPSKNSRSELERKPSDLTDLNMIMTMNPLNNNKSFKKKCGDHNADYIGLYFILIICLVGLVFSGKAFAIFCTATCLFFIPRRPELNQIRA